MTEEYIRPDGRSRKVLRDLKIEVGVLDRADGSSRVDLGKNIAIATVYVPSEMHPKHAARPDKAQMRINYRMATFSVDDYDDDVLTEPLSAMPEKIDAADMDEVEEPVDEDDED